MVIALISLNILSALAALAAAWFWLKSARLPMPAQTSYYGTIPANDPVHEALLAVARLNQIAASFAGGAALLQAAVAVAALFRRS
jgi:hypothetical protein